VIVEVEFEIEIEVGFEEEIVIEIARALTAAG
jgi:hypothetical protein